GAAPGSTPTTTSIGTSGPPRRSARPTSAAPTCAGPIFATWISTWSTSAAPDTPRTRPNTSADAGPSSTTSQRRDDDFPGDSAPRDGSDMSITAPGVLGDELVRLALVPDPAGQHDQDERLASRRLDDRRIVIDAGERAGLVSHRDARGQPGGDPLVELLAA